MDFQNVGFDFEGRGVPGHGPVHLLLISAADLGFAWDGDEKGWVRPSLPPPQDDGWSYPTFLLFHIGCLAVQCICQVV